MYKGYGFFRTALSSNGNVGKLCRKIAQSKKIYHRDKKKIVHIVNNKLQQCEILGFLVKINSALTIHSSVAICQMAIRRIVKSY